MQLTGAEIVVECLKEQRRGYRIRLSGRRNPKCI